jgi:hypothetical protein
MPKDSEEPVIINGIPVVNKDWTCSRCGATWTVCTDAENPRCIHCKPITEKEQKRMHLQLVPEKS